MKNNLFFGLLDERGKLAQAVQTSKQSLAECRFSTGSGACPGADYKTIEGNTMKWETPAYNDVRFGFEVTMYNNNR